MKTRFAQGSKSNAETQSRQRPSSSTSAAPSMSPSHGMNPDQMLELQSHAGNQEVLGMTQSQSSRSSSSGSLPAPLRSGVESLSGMSMDNVNVHNNSDKPAQTQAHAFAQGTDIHIGPGQEKHIPHEAWHVEQQKQGRVQPKLQV